MGDSLIHLDTILLERDYLERNKDYNGDLLPYPSSALNFMNSSL